MILIDSHKIEQKLKTAAVYPAFGFVTNVVGLLIEAHCREATMGSLCEIYNSTGQSSIMAEVVGFRNDHALLMPLGSTFGITQGSRVVLRRRSATVKIGPKILGRVLDGLGEAIDGGPELECEEEFSIYTKPLNPLRRQRIDEVIDVGIRSINGLLTFGKGQRIGILAGSGVGKSVLIGMMAQHTNADVNIIALIGERGREVREFLERDLGPEGLAKSVVICATSDMPPLIRMRAAHMATTIAEYFRRAGKDVLFIMDSVTRFAMAQREIGLSAGEPPTSKGYPPSVFTSLPGLFERIGNLTSGGSITGLYTVLTEGDDINDPIGDAVRAIVDGHIVLDRKIAAKDHYPAIDVRYSASRVMDDVVTPDVLAISRRIKKILANYAEAEDLINIGAYVKGSNSNIDEAIQFIGRINAFLKQDRTEGIGFDQSIAEMKAIFQGNAKGRPK